MHRESTVHTLVMKTYTHHNINVGNSVPQLISPLLVEGGPVWVLAQRSSAVVLPTPINNNAALKLGNPVLSWNLQ